MRCKHGQAAGAAILLAIIAGLLVLFILNLSPADRAELLDDERTATARGSNRSLDTQVAEKILLLATPGRIDFLVERELQHPLPVVNIYTRQEAKILAEKTMVYARKGIFQEDTGELRFSVPDLEHTENLLLSFTATSLNGRLVILLNDQVLLNSNLASGTTRPIPLPKSMLQQDNVLVFRVSSPGFAFWQTNEAVLENVKVVADITNVEAQSSRQIFLISDTEKNNMERITLKFQPSCLPEDAGKLNIKVNGAEIYAGFPDCAMPMIPLEFSPTQVHVGENEVVFRTERGSYVLSHVNVESKLKGVEFPTYYFDLSNEEFRAAREGTRRVRVRLDFVDVATSKYGDVVVNGALSSFDTKEVLESLDITRDVVNGRNSVKVKPRKTVEIRELKVELVR